MAWPPALALIALAAAADPSASPAVAAEARGRLLFETGTRADGTPVVVFLGEEAAAVPGAVLPCAGCHGLDGRGRPEGAVVPPPLGWRELTSPRGHVHGRRSHQPFDARRFAQAVVEGIDPSGHPLDPAMPRYSLSREDLEGLVAWLQRLDTRLEPGLTETTLRLGTVLPAGGPARQAGLALRALLEAILADVNAAGGVNGRTLALTVREAAPGAGAAAVRDLAAGGEVFALVAGLLPGEEGSLAGAAEAVGLPLVGLQARGRVAGATDEARMVFTLLAGPAEQARLLVGFAARDLGLAGRPAVVLRPPDGEAVGAEAAQAEARALGWRGLEEIVVTAGPDGALGSRLAAAGTEVVLHLGDDAALGALLREAAAAGWRPTVLVPGALAGRAAAEGAPGFEGRLFLAFPAAPADETAAGRARLARLVGEDRAGRHHVLQASTAAAAALLLEGLRRAGHQLDREGLVRALEGIQGLETGLIPALSYGPGRRIGALGGYVVEADPARRAFRPVAGWRSLE